MKLGIILNTNAPETVWNALRLGNEALAAGNEVGIFLLGSGVEIENIKDKTFDVAGVLARFLQKGGSLLACGTCLTSRKQQAGVCSISTMPELVKMITDSDKVVTLG
ncbi:MAG: DsrE family protein [Dehalococcoidales bacterium]|nr:DsrE family protein [Dehalococcoidales bacterium]